MKKSAQKKNREGVDLFFNPISSKQFINEFYEKDLFLFNNKNVEDILDYFSVLELKTAASLLNAHRGMVNIIYPGKLGIHKQSNISIDLARELYEMGSTLAVNLVDESVPQIKKMCHLLASQLGLRDNMVTCNAYISGPEKGLQPHWDNHGTFIVQLLGKKRWLISPNQDVTYPHLGHSAGPYSTPKSLKIYCPPVLLESMPKTSIAVEMTPGAVIYVPHGWWHQTSSIGESVSLTFGISAPKWIDLLTHTLSYKLLKYAHWRKKVHFAWSPESKQTIKNITSEMLNEASILIKNMDPEEFIEEYPFDKFGKIDDYEAKKGEAVYVLASNVTVQIQKEDKDMFLLAKSSKFRNGQVFLRVSGDTLKMCKWISKQREKFSALKASQQLNLDFYEITRLFSELLKIGILDKIH